jgi:RimJ/RimL family protein N-acetyltransferase
VHTILNAKRQQQGKSDVRDLARGDFLKLFIAPTGKQGRYLDIDVSRLRSSSISVIHDGRKVDRPLALQNLAARIATTAGWNLNDYPIVVVASKEQDIVDHQQYGSDEEGAMPGGQCRQTVLVLHWCGIGRRSTPLDYWQVFLIQAHSEIVGVSGLYRQPAMAVAACWLGWFAIRPGFRRQGLGTAAIAAVCDFARNLAYKELWVYTDAANDVAIKFYTRLNFELLGAARDCAPGKTMADSDIVLRQTLSVR